VLFALQFVQIPHFVEDFHAAIPGFGAVALFVYFAWFAVLKMPGFFTAKYAKYAKMFCFEFRSCDRRSLRFSVGKLLVAASPRCDLLRN
jgi:hypothetical protein